MRRAASPTPAAFHTPTSETPAASRRSSRLGSSVPAYSGGSDAAIAAGVDARNVLPVLIGGEARLPQPAAEVEAASAMPAALSSPAPAPAKPSCPSACACALVQPFATAAMQLFGVNLALRSLDCKVPCVAEDTTQLFDVNLALRRRSHRRRPGRRWLTVALRTTPQSTQSPTNIGPTRRYV